MWTCWSLGSALARQREGDSRGSGYSSSVGRPCGREAERPNHFIEFPRIIAVQDFRVHLVPLHSPVHPDPEGHVERCASQLFGRIVEGKREVSKLRWTRRPTSTSAFAARPGTGSRVAPDSRPAPPTGASTFSRSESGSRGNGVTRRRDGDSRSLGVSRDRRQFCRRLDGNGI